MARIPFESAVFLYRKNKKAKFEYAVFKRVEGKYWQVIVGGGEGKESPIETARREAFEEANVPISKKYFQLKTITSIPVHLCPDRKDWPKDLYVIPAYYFAADGSDVKIVLSDEHSEYKWVDYETASKLLHWESDKTALWELNERLLNKDILSLM